MNELNTLLGTMEMENLSPEEIKLLQAEAQEEFNKIPGVEFEEHTKDDIKNLETDFKITRKVLTKNIDNVEKLTNMLMTQVAMQPENGILVGNTIAVISEQNKQLKLLSEIHNKTLTNKQLANKINEPEKGKSKSKLPPGLTAK